MNNTTSIAPKDFRINFEDVQNTTVYELIEQIMELPGLPMNEISFSVLAKDQEIFKTPIMQWDGQKAYGTGVYIFKKRDEHGITKPVYAGVAPKNFLDRFYGHLNTKFRQHWGWNAMLQFVGSGILNQELIEVRGEKNKLLPSPALEAALDWMQDSRIILVDFNPNNEAHMRLRRRFETIVIKGLMFHDIDWMKQGMKSTYNANTMNLTVSQILN